GTAGLQGDVAEVIVFNQKINTAQRRIIENYLAAKYGLTLSANDLYTMDTPGNGDYDHDVAGIGRINGTNQQNDSRGTGIVRVLNPGSFSDGDYFFWGHDNNPMTAQFTDLPSGVQSRYSRVWRGQEVGSIPDFDIEFDLTGLASVSASQLRLLVDTDNDGQFADETPISGAVAQGGDRYRFVNVTALTATTATARRFTIAVSGQAPGGVSGNLVWWLKADLGALE